MEIHPPRPVASLKDFFRELLTITAGILIALSLEGLLQWNHHRQLVREARTTIARELRENGRELDKEETALASMQQDIGNIIKLVHQLELRPGMPVGSIHYGFTLSELHSTAWDTARTTGAVSYMRYQEVERYTQVYDLQHEFEQLQQRAFASSLDMQGLTTLLDRKAGTITPAELSDAERRLGILLANVIAMQQIAKPLKDRYEETLETTATRQYRAAWEQHSSHVAAVTGNSLARYAANKINSLWVFSRHLAHAIDSAKVRLLYCEVANALPPCDMLHRAQCTIRPPEFSVLRFGKAHA